MSENQKETATKQLLRERHIKLIFDSCTRIRETYLKLKGQQKTSSSSSSSSPTATSISTSESAISEIMTEVESIISYYGVLEGTGDLQTEQEEKKMKFSSLIKLKRDSLLRCLICGTSDTPEWRRGPVGPRTLCNACGLVYAKMVKKKNSVAPKDAVEQELELKRQEEEMNLLKKKKRLIEFPEDSNEQQFHSSPEQNSETQPSQGFVEVDYKRLKNKPSSSSSSSTISSSNNFSPSNLSNLTSFQQVNMISQNKNSNEFMPPPSQLQFYTQFSPISTQPQVSPPQQQQKIQIQQPVKPLVHPTAVKPIQPSPVIQSSHPMLATPNSQTATSVTTTTTTTTTTTLNEGSNPPNTLTLFPANPLYYILGEKRFNEIPVNMKDPELHPEVLGEVGFVRKKDKKPTGQNKQAPKSNELKLKEREQTQQSQEQLTDQQTTSSLKFILN